MKALSIQQPWAWLIVNGYKGIENRNWNTKYRGIFHVHASKQFDKKGYQWVKDNFPTIPLPKREEFDSGGIVGYAFLTHTVHISDAAYLYSGDKPWFFGEYGFILDSAEPLPFIPCKGKLGFFTV